MDDRFFEKPVLNSPYQFPLRHWELDDQGQPTQQIIEKRRQAIFITPIPKPRKRKDTVGQQLRMVFNEGKGLSTQEQLCDPTSIINKLTVIAVTVEDLELNDSWPHFLKTRHPNGLDRIHEQVLPKDPQKAILYHPPLLQPSASS